MSPRHSSVVIIRGEAHVQTDSLGSGLCSDLRQWSIILEVEYWLQTPYFIPFDKLTVNIYVLGVDDGDSMGVSGAHHPINQNPCPSAWLELQDLIQAVSIITS